MPTIRAAFDCDGVLLNFYEIFEDYARIEGYQIDPKSANRFEYDLIPPVTFNEMCGMIDDCLARRTVDMDPYEGAEDLVAQLWKDTNDPIQIITARKAVFASQTEIALARVFKSIPHFTAYTCGTNKLDYMKRYPVIIEDRRGTAKRLAISGKVVIVPKRPWNWPMNEPSFLPDRGWRWVDEKDFKDLDISIGAWSSTNWIWFGGVIIYINSLRSLLDNQRLYEMLIRPKRQRW
jgi:hypothetical protein